MILGGWAFLMSEVPLYTQEELEQLQGYHAHKKHPPRRTRISEVPLNTREELKQLRGGREQAVARQSAPTPTAVERTWNTQDSHGQILALV